MKIDEIHKHCIVCYDDQTQQTLASKLAATLMLACDSYHHSSHQHYAYVLYYKAQQLFLLCQQQPAFKPFTVDFTQGQLAYRLRQETSIRQPIARAIGIKPKIRPTVLDISAGFGQDASILANLGCTVILLERHPIVWALLHDGLTRAKNAGCLWATHITLHRQAAQLYCDQIIMSNRLYPDVIYYDPMFPPTNNTANVQKPMQILQALVEHEDTDIRLFNTAKQLAAKRLVVKRPNYAVPLFDMTPSLQIKMVKHRFDVYLCT